MPVTCVAMPLVALQTKLGTCLPKVPRKNFWGQKAQKHMAAWLLRFCGQHKHTDMNPNQASNAYRCMAAVILWTTQT